MYFIHIICKQKYAKRRLHIATDMIAWKKMMKSIEGILCIENDEKKIDEKCERNESANSSNSTRTSSLEVRNKLHPLVICCVNIRIQNMGRTTSVYGECFFLWRTLEHTITSQQCTFTSCICAVFSEQICYGSAEINKILLEFLTLNIFFDGSIPNAMSESFFSSLSSVVVVVLEK